MRKEIVRTDAAPLPIGPYSQCVRLGDLLFVAAQGPVDPTSREIVAADIQSQTRQTIENVRAILEAAGSSLDNVLKTSCFLRNLDDFRAFNEVYAAFFPSNAPARTTIQPARLPGDWPIAIDAIAFVP